MPDNFLYLQLPLILTIIIEFYIINVECNLSKDNLEGSVFAEGLGLLFVQKSEINKDIYQ